MGRVGGVVLLKGTVGRVARRFEIGLECFTHLIALLIGFFLGGDPSCNGTRPDHSKNRIRNGVVDSQTAKGDTTWLAIVQPAAAATVARNGEGQPTDATDIKPPQTRFRGRSQALLIQSLATAPLVGPGS